MNEQGYEQLTLFPEDSHASRFPSPGSKEARMMTVTSGRKCSELYENSDPLGCLVRMCLESSIWHSTRCLLTWKTKDTPARRSLFRLVASTPRTDATELPFWPTPTTGSPFVTGSRVFKVLELMRDKDMITEEERRAFSAGNGGKTNPEFLEWLMGYEKAFTGLVPTPRAHDYAGTKLNRFIGGVLQTSVNGACRGHSAWENWPPEPGVGRVADGVPNRVDRIRCLGNAVVPQQFYLFFKLIADIESGECHERV